MSPGLMGLSLVGKWGGGAAVSAVLPFSGVTVNADGWTLNATIGASKDGGTYAGLNDHTTPGLALTVTSTSWNTSGIETTISRTVIATAVLRNPYPDQATLEETEDGADLDVIFTLSDYIYADDMVTCSVAEGFFTDDGTGGSTLENSAQTPAVTNSSSQAYPPPIAMWADHDLRWIKEDTPTFHLAVAHLHARSGQTVRAVKFIATDESTNSTEVIVTSMSKMDFTGSGLSASVFAGTLDFTDLDQGELITVDAIIYPWVGDSYQISVSGATYPSPNLTVLKALNDRTGAYGTVYAYVDGVGAGTEAVSTNPATAATTPFTTIAEAASAIQTYNNSNFSRNNVSGGIIRLTATTHTHATFSARAVGAIPLIIEAADAGDKATTIFRDSGSSIFNGIPDYLHIRNITLQKQGAGNIVFLDMTPVGGNLNALIIENCTFDLNGTSLYNGWILQAWRLWLINCDGDNCGQATRLSNNIKHTHSIGSGTAGSINTAVYSAIGCKDLDGTWTGGVIGTGWEVPLGPMLAFSHVGRGGIAVNVNRDIGAAGVAAVGNVVEAFGASGFGLFSFGGSGVNVMQNAIDLANTIVGERSFIHYNDSGSTAYAQRGISSLSVHSEWNSKSDTFSPENGARTGNWPIIYRVGSMFRAALIGSSQDDTPGVGSWLGEIAARGDATGTSADSINADWVDDQSFTVTGAGNGDYTPGASTELPQVPAGLTAFPFDQKGRTVPTDGSAYVGAVQVAA